MLMKTDVFDPVTTEFDDQPLRYQTMSSILKARANRIGDRTFLYYDREGIELSFDDVNDAANSIARGLVELGIGHGDRVAVIMKQPVDTLLAMFGINKAGAIYAPINYEYKGSPLAYHICDLNPAVIMVEEEFLDDLNAVTDELDREHDVIVSETGAGAGRPNSALEHVSNFRSLRRTEPVALDVDTTWDDSASIVYTSGTTGRPKGVVLPYRYIFANYTLMFSQLLNSDDLTHSPLPMYHVAAVYADITSALVSGSAVSLWDKFSPNDFWDRIDQYGATTATLISVMWSWLAKQPERNNDHHNTLSNLRIMPLPDDYQSISDRFGFDFLTCGFGQTESGLPLAGLIHTSADDRRKPAEYRRGKQPPEVVEDVEDLGIPVVSEVPGERFMAEPAAQYMEAKVVDDKGEELPPEDVGQLVVRPKLPGIIMRRYFGKPEMTVEAFQDLWFHTGDAAYRDENGYYYFVDRIGDVIRRRGENISSIQIQEEVNALDMVEDGAVFPIWANEGGEDEIAAAIERADAGVTETDIREKLDGRLPAFMIPDEIVFVDEIPTTETNKRRKNQLREQYF